MSLSGKARYSPGNRNVQIDRARSDFILSSSSLRDRSGKLSGKVLAAHLAQRTAIYAIGREFLPPIKIGFSRRPKGRLAEMQITSPEELRFHSVCWLPTTLDATKLEARCHQFLKEQGCHVRGEWFYLDPKGAKLAIDAMAVTLGCRLVPHKLLTDTFQLSKDPLGGCFWEQ